MRGGSNNCSSFLWADRKEHLYFNENEEPIIPYQIIGHTPVTHIDLNNKFIFIRVNNNKFMAAKPAEINNIVIIAAR